ncbi:MAG: hypothetical protein QOG52_394 [Frankiaceae bacterium]|nr:hypothetical protein [Frankiaceae bacterium]
MTPIAAPRSSASPRFSSSPAPASQDQQRAASLALVRARLRQVPGLVVTEERGTPGGDCRLRIDVRDTGLSGREIARRVRALGDATLDRCDDDGIVAVFDAGESIADRGSRLLFALGHACAADR